MTTGTRLIVFAGCLLVSFALFNCADPLDITNQPVPPNQNPSDTLFVVDTVYVIDTVTRTEFDTTIIIDTVFHSDVDTTMIVDTVTQNHYDTTYVIDTVYQSDLDTILIVDTVVVVDPDTVSIVDTIYQTDTLRVVDTIYVDADSTQMMCGRIESCQKEIVWLLQNEPGQYHLSFAAFTEKDQPEQSLTVEIGDNSYSWNTIENVNLDVDQALTADASIIITSQKPPARGHAVYVCLSIVRQ